MARDVGRGVKKRRKGTNPERMTLPYAPAYQTHLPIARLRREAWTDPRSGEVWPAVEFCSDCGKKVKSGFEGPCPDCGRTLKGARAIS
jgi:hypothetical protein